MTRRKKTHKTSIDTSRSCTLAVNNEFSFEKFPSELLRTFKPDGMSLHRVQYKCLSIEIGALFKHSPDSSSPQRGHLLNKCRRGVRIASGSVKRCHGKRRLDCTIVRGPVLHCDECSLLELIVFLGCQVQQFLAASKKLRYKCANPKPRLPHNSMQEQRIIYRPSPMGTPNSGDIETRDIAQ